MKQKHASSLLNTGCSSLYHIRFCCLEAWKKQTTKKNSNSTLQRRCGRAARANWPRACCARRRELGPPPCSWGWPSSPPPPPWGSSPSGPAAGCCAERDAQTSERTAGGQWGGRRLGAEEDEGLAYTLAWLRSSSFSSASFWLLSSIPSTTCFSLRTSSWSFWLLIWRSATQYTNSDVSLGGARTEVAVCSLDNFSVATSFKRNLRVL